MTATHADRMATARRALERAEAAAGLRTRLASPLRIADDGASAGHGAVTPRDHGTLALADDGAPADDGALALAEHGAAAGRASAVESPTAERSPRPVATGAARSGAPAARAVGLVTGGVVADHLPVPSALAAFFPADGLRRGSVVQVGGSSSLLLALLAAAQAEGWAGLAALPDLGLQAAAEAGLSLERTLLVPRPGPEAASVVGALVDGVDVLAVGDCRALGARDRRLLSARLRSRGAVLLSTAHWPGADVVLRAGEAHAAGLGRGWGGVTGNELTVHGRARSGAAGRVRVSLGPGGLAAVGEELRHGSGTRTGQGWDTGAGQDVLAGTGPGLRRAAGTTEAAVGSAGQSGAASPATATGPPAETARPPLQAVS